MNAKIKVTLAVIFFIAAFLIFYSSGNSKILSADRLYALKLKAEPNEKEWEDAVPFTVIAKNGNLHEVHKTVDIDKDSVHTTTASCHHNTPIAPPVTISLKAYYTDDELFIRATWVDLTKDNRLFEFKYNDDKWNISDRLEDALGMMWDMTYQKKPFRCSIACHSSDWKLKDYSLVSKFKMGTIGDDVVDLWSWKAYRTNIFNFADDRFIGKDGIMPDTPSKIYFYNADKLLNKPLSESARDIKPLSDGDTPMYDYNGMPIKSGYWMLTGTAPGVRVSSPSGNRAGITVNGNYKDNRWTVTFRRSLLSDDKMDVTFNLNLTKSYKFGVAVFDNTLTDHYAVDEPLELIFVDGTKIES